MRRELASVLEGKIESLQGSDGRTLDSTPGLSLAFGLGLAAGDVGRDFEVGEGRQSQPKVGGQRLGRVLDSSFLHLHFNRMRGWSQQGGVGVWAAQLDQCGYDEGLSGVHLDLFDLLFLGREMFEVWGELVLWSRFQR